MKKVILGIITVLIFSIGLFGQSSKDCEYTVAYYHASEKFMSRVIETTARFVTRVNKRMQEGWKPQGGMTGTEYSYFQALIKCPEK